MTFSHCRNEHRRRHKARKRGGGRRIGLPYFLLYIRYSPFLFLGLLRDADEQTVPGFGEGVCPLLSGTRFDCSDNHSYLIASLLATLLTCCAKCKHREVERQIYIFAKQISSEVTLYDATRIEWAYLRPCDS